VCSVFLAGHTVAIPPEAACGAPPDEQYFSDQCLQQMQEPRLAEAGADKNAVVYRISIFPVWGNSIVVRAQKVGAIYKLWGQELSPGKSCGKLVARNEVVLSAVDSKTLDALIAHLNLFQMPAHDRVDGCDGDTWVLEGVLGGQYHVVERWCASHCDCGERGLKPFVALCKFLVEKSHSHTPTNKGRRLL
jgi:hypothetical protein